MGKPQVTFRKSAMAGWEIQTSAKQMVPNNAKNRFSSW
jgi:hypothetical protein